MDSLNSFPIGFYTLLSYSYSQRYTHLTLGSWERDVGRTEKQKRKIFSFSFFRAKPISLTYRTACLEIHLYTYVLRVCAVYYAEGRDIPTLSRMRSGRLQCKTFAALQSYIAQEYTICSRFPLTLRPLAKYKPLSKHNRPSYHGRSFSSLLLGSLDLREDFTDPSNPIFTGTSGLSVSCGSTFNNTSSLTVHYLFLCHPIPQHPLPLVSVCPNSLTAHVSLPSIHGLTNRGRLTHNIL